METTEVHSPLQIPTQRPPEGAYPYMDAAQRASQSNPPFWPLNAHRGDADVRSNDGYADRNSEEKDVYQGIGGDIRMPTQEPPKSAYPLTGRNVNEYGYAHTEDAYYPENRGVSLAYPHDDEGGEKDYYM
jgi:hypothetical protein